MTLDIIFPKLCFTYRYLINNVIKRFGLGFKLIFKYKYLPNYTDNTLNSYAFKNT